ncbi:MAG TPA: M14 family zinc carboxypeptidase [Ignavibacteriaceae bacterium]|nr:M14 family zinc carboxypeptidase [Ignavibacteriaceae bacterium]
MKSIAAILVFFLFTFSITNAQNYKQLKVFIHDQMVVEQLFQMGVDLEHSSSEKDNSIILFVSDDEFNLIKQSGVQYQVLIDDWSEYYNSLPSLTENDKQIIKNDSKNNFGVEGFGFGSMGGYYTFNEIVANLDSMYAQYSNIITEKYSVGTSQQGRTIWAVKISDNPNNNESEPAVGYDALIHAREPQSMASMMYFMWYLLENYGTDPEVTYLVNNREMYFIPCVNPDGYEYNRQTNPTGGGMWRKNRRNNGDGSYGVDLNRNFGYMWGYDNNGSSPTPSSETYRGPSPFSEPEAVAVRDLAIQKNYGTHFNMHSWQNAFLYPWGYINLQTPDSLIYREFAQDMSAYNNYVYGISGQILGYNSNGSVRDWMYGEQIAKAKAFGYTVEIGSSSDGFWPPQHRIYPLAQGMLKPNLYNAWVAGSYVSLIDAGYSQQYFNPGDVVFMNSVFRNKGLANSENIDLQLSSLSPYITINNGSSSLGSVPSRGTAIIATPFSFTVSSSAPVDVEARLLLTTLVNNAAINQDTLVILLGTPVFVFVDTTNNPLNLWTVTATPVSSPKWEATTQSFYSAPVSYTDSKDGNYIANATVIMATTDPIDLTGLTNPKLSFWTRYDIESNYDYGQVKISTNIGTTWIPLEGQYTEPGVGSFQPNGEPVYDGVQSSWVREDISLSEYISSQTKIQFQLRTDGSVHRDGWYVDDIAIYYLGIIPVELISFSAELNNNKAVLNWVTASETNNYGFEIEKSQKPNVNGQNNWEKIGFVNGNGTTTEVSTYIFTDELTQTQNQNQNLYYRLKQIDLDGSFSYSDIIEIELIKVDRFSLVQNYPNPFNPSTIISYQLPSNGNISLKVYDVLGNVVAVLVDEYKQIGRYETEFDGSDLSSGIYYYILIADGFTQTKKMVLLK